MRYKFRGKRLDNGEWVYGMLCKTFVNSELENGYGIQVTDEFEMTSYPVIPETVGQFTTVLDKNDIEICEGDIVNVPRGNYEIKFINGSFCINDHDDGYWAIRGRGKWFTVIGSVHDNPELLK